MSQVTKCDRCGKTDNISTKMVTLVIGEREEGGTAYDLADVCPKCVEEIARYAENNYRIKRKTKKEKALEHKESSEKGGDT